MIDKKRESANFYEWEKPVSTYMTQCDLAETVLK